MPYVVASILIQLALVVHILKTRRDSTWVFIVLFFPLIGSLAYFIVELLPQLARTKALRDAKRKVSQTLDPEKDLRAAADNLSLSDTVQNAMALAESCFKAGHFAEAEELFTRSLKGPHAEDPQLLLGLARAQFGGKRYAAAVQTLDLLKRSNPSFRSSEGHLLYARSQEELGNVDAAMHEYEVLSEYYAGPEPACRLGLIHKARGEAQKASQIFAQVLNKSRVAGRHYNDLHREWIALAKREVA